MKMFLFFYFFFIFLKNLEYLSNIYIYKEKSTFNYLNKILNDDDVF